MTAPEGLVTGRRHSFWDRPPVGDDQGFPLPDQAPSVGPCYLCGAITSRQDPRVGYLCPGCCADLSPQSAAAACFLSALRTYNWRWEPNHRAPWCRPWRKDRHHRGPRYPEMMARARARAVRS